MNTNRHRRRTAVGFGYQLNELRSHVGYSESPGLRMMLEQWHHQGVSQEQVVQRLKSGGRVYGDCSGLISGIFEYAGFEDPNALGYNLLGYTGTLLDNQKDRHFWDPRKAGPAGITVWGAHPGRHATMTMVPGTDPLELSHGDGNGPVLIRFSALRAYFGTFTLIDISHL